MHFQSGSHFVQLCSIYYNLYNAPTKEKNDTNVVRTKNIL